MSTKCSIKWKNRDDGRPGYHLYTDVLDSYNTDDPPVYLELNGVDVEVQTLENGAHVTVTIPGSIAKELGLLRRDAAEEKDK